jgi:hypothetical protein
MTPSQQAKKAGLYTLTQVSEMTGQSLQTLISWHKNKQKLFDVVVIGCAEKLKDHEGSGM